MFETIHAWEMGLHEMLQQIRSPMLDKFFMQLNFFDLDYFYFILLPVVWAVFGRVWGCRVLYLILLSAIVNAAAKDLFGQPRPSQLDPSIGLVQLSSFGFPSGAAQSHCILAGLAILAMPRVLPIVFFTLWLGVISFSRIYLGAHFLTDVIGGWAIGLMLVYAYVQFHDRLEKWASRLSAKQALLAACVIPIALLLPYITVKMVVFTSMIFGVNMGLWLSAYASRLKLEPLGTWQRKLVYVVLVIAIMFWLGTNTTGIPKELLNSFETKLRFGAIYTCIGLWLSWGAERLLLVFPNKKIA
ncbi:MAG: phosphatase PAP2 family protein [Chlamydiales bacterium]|nr:phosphatase PAP2 family protein [Chlamydiales bacterium]